MHDDMHTTGDLDFDACTHDFDGYRLWLLALDPPPDLPDSELDELLYLLDASVPNHVRL